MTKKVLLQKWIEFYDFNAKEPILSEMYFESMAIGFFYALGSTPSEAFELYQECIKIGKF